MRFAAFGLDLLRRADGATLDEREENRLVAECYGRGLTTPPRLANSSQTCVVAGRRRATAQ